ncbi:MAG: hypothetical protein HQL73_13620 [Magnetococcales bacterium]|nr:hypothetical protein [Magnetococcales bacterium]
MTLKRHDRPGKIAFPLLAVVILTLLAVANNVALAAPALDRVMSLLQGYEWRDRSEGFLALGEDTDQVLMDIAANPQWHAVIRFRALGALRYFPNDKVARFLESFIAQDLTSDYLRRSLDAFAAAFGQDQPARVAQLAEPLLQHQDPQIRVRAAQTLEKLPRGVLSLHVQQALDAKIIPDRLQ